MNSTPQDSDTTTVQVGDATLVISLSDLADMRASLIDQLKASDLEDRSELLLRTEGSAPVIGPDGSGHIGGWLLDTRGNKPVLSRRFAVSEHAVKGYLAFLEQRAGKWLVIEVVTERIRVAPQR